MVLTILYAIAGGAQQSSHAIGGDDPIGRIFSDCSRLPAGFPTHSNAQFPDLQCGENGAGLLLILVPERLATFNASSAQTACYHGETGRAGKYARWLGRGYGRRTAALNAGIPNASSRLSSTMQNHSSVNPLFPRTNRRTQRSSCVIIVPISRTGCRPRAGITKRKIKPNSTPEVNHLLISE